MNQHELALLAGSISTITFAASNIPMLIKVWRTKDLRSYSLAYIALSNLGNLVHWVYIASLPFGPVWLMHGYYTVTTLLLLVLYLRYRPKRTRRKTVRGRNADIFQTQEMYAV
jgi:uncharacterized protein with PQ loop repeat